MHEASLVQNMIRVIDRSCEKQPGIIRKVHLAVGMMSGAIPSALETAFAILKKGTRVEEAELCMQMVPLKLQCPHCGKSFETDSFVVTCPHCREIGLRILEGEDINIISVEVADPE